MRLKPASPLAALVFKTLAEQHVGELCLLRLFAGAIKPGDEVANPDKRSTERIGQIFHLNGNKRAEVDSAEAGDIGTLEGNAAVYGRGIKGHRHLGPGMQPHAGTVDGRLKGTLFDDSGFQHGNFIPQYFY